MEAEAHGSHEGGGSRLTCSSVGRTELKSRRIGKMRLLRAGTAAAAAPLHTVHLVMHTAKCTLHNVHYILHAEHCTVNSAHYTLHTAQCTLHTANCSVYLHCKLFTAHCSLNIASFPCGLITVHYTLLTFNIITAICFLHIAHGTLCITHYRH